MKVSIPCLYAIYGRYTDELRAIPFHYDCLKPVERRVLYVLHKETKTKLTKSAKIVGDCIGSYHPHGDVSTYDSLVGLVHRGFAIGQGNWGDLSLKPTSPAKYRYTKCKINPDLDNFCFEYIDFVQWGDPENLQVEQPLYISSPVPVGLIGVGVTTGISFNVVKMPRYTLKDLIDRLINIKQRRINPTIPVHTIIPNIPNFHIEEEHIGDFENILTTGKGTIVLKPHMTTDNYGVHVWGRPPGGVSSWLRTPEQQVYNVDDMTSKGVFEALFSPKDKVTYDQTFVNHIFNTTTSKINFICNVVKDDGTVELKSIDSLLEESYDNWVQIILSKMKSDEQILQNKIHQLNLILIIRSIILQLGNGITKVQDIVDEFNQNIHLYPQYVPDEVKSVCSKYNIKTLVEINVDISAVQQKLLKLQSDINNIDQIAYSKMLTYIS